MRYLSRILIILLLITGCSNKTYEYIDPINNPSYFSLLNDSLKDELIDIYEKELDNYQLMMIAKKLKDLSFYDINLNKYNLLDFKDEKLVIEVVSVGCSSCLKQIKYHNEEIFNNNEDIKFIQYFSSGTKSEIIDLYQNNNIDIYDGVIVEESDDFYDYLKELDVKYTPFLLFFENGELIYSKENVTTYEQFIKIKDYVYNKHLSLNDLVNNDGISIFDIKQRDYEDIKKDLSGLSIKRLEDIDINPLFTYSIMSRKVIYSELLNGEGYSQISNYRPYSKKDTIFIYLRLNNDDLKKIELINSIISSYPDLSFICVLMKDTNSYEIYKDNNYSINCPIVSSDSNLPVMLKDIETYKDIACIFIEKGVITGGLTNIESLKHFDDSLSIFFGTKAIAHKDVNQ